MPSTKVPILRDNIAGEDTTTRPHLVADNKWTVANGVRTVNSLSQQVPRKYRVWRLNHNADVQGIQINYILDLGGFGFEQGTFGIGSAVTWGTVISILCNTYDFDGNMVLDLIAGIREGDTVTIRGLDVTSSFLTFRVASTEPQGVDGIILNTDLSSLVFGGVPIDTGRYGISSGVADNPHPVQVIANIPTNRRNQALVVALTPRQANQIIRVEQASGASWIGADKRLGFFSDGRTAVFNHDPNVYRRWATVIYANQLWFTNEINPLLHTDGCKIRKYATKTPAARYIEEFFDHIVVAHEMFDGEYCPTRVHWSHLYDPSSWCPKQGNEADFFDVQSWVDTDAMFHCITGLKKIRDVLMIYTPNSIIGCRYVGLPKVMQFAPITEEVGCSLMYGLAWHNNVHFFFDGNERDFFMFDGEEIKSIGGGIRNFFLSNISGDFVLQQKTWAYTRPETYEVTWVFVSQASSAERFDLSVTYNWRTGEWYHGSVEDLHAFGGNVRPSRNLITLFTEEESTIDNLPDTLDELSDANNQTLAFPRLWGTSYGILLAEDDTGYGHSPSLGELIYVSPGVLETKDLHYGTIQEFKELDTTTIHGAFATGQGVEVSISARDHVDDTVSYTVVGIWTPTLPEKRLSFPRIAGRIFRYRFRFVDGLGSPSTITPYVVAHSTNREFGATYAGDPEQTPVLPCGTDPFQGTTGFYQPRECPAGTHFNFEKNQCVEDGSDDPGTILPPDPNPPPNPLPCILSQRVFQSFTSGINFYTIPAGIARVFFLLIGAGGGGGGKVVPGVFSDCSHAFTLNTYATDYLLSINPTLANLADMISRYGLVIEGMVTYQAGEAPDLSQAFTGVMTKVGGQNVWKSDPNASFFFTSVSNDPGDVTYAFPCTVTMVMGRSDDLRPDATCFPSVKIGCRIFNPGVGFVTHVMSFNDGENKLSFTGYYAQATDHEGNLMGYQFDPSDGMPAVRVDSFSSGIQTGSEVINDDGTVTEPVLINAHGGAAAVVAGLYDRTGTDLDQPLRLQITVGACPDDTFDEASGISNGSQGEDTSILFLDNGAILRARGGQGGSVSGVTVHNGLGGVPQLVADTGTVQVALFHEVPMPFGAFGESPQFVRDPNHLMGGIIGQRGSSNGGGVNWAFIENFTKVRPFAQYGVKPVRKGERFGGGGAGPGHWNADFTSHDDDPNNSTKGGSGVVVIQYCLP